MEDKMKSRSGLFMLLVVVVMLILAACGGAATRTEAPLLYPDEPAAATEAPAEALDSFAQPGAAVDKALVEGQAAVEELPLAPMATAAAFEITNSSGNLTVI